MLAVVSKNPLPRWLAEYSELLVPSRVVSFWLRRTFSVPLLLSLARLLPPEPSMVNVLVLPELLLEKLRELPLVFTREELSLWEVVI